MCTGSLLPQAEGGHGTVITRQLLHWQVSMRVVWPVFRTGGRHDSVAGGQGAPSSVLSVLI